MKNNHENYTREIERVRDIVKEKLNLAMIAIDHLDEMITKLREQPGSSEAVRKWEECRSVVDEQKTAHCAILGALDNCPTAEQYPIQ